jgi:phage gp36-like protein
MGTRKPLQFASIKALGQPPAPPPQTFARVSVADKRQALRRASSWIAPYLRHRHHMPLAVLPEDVTVMSAGGALASIAGTPGRVADVVVKIASGGRVGVDALSCAVSFDDGATFGAPVALDPSGEAEVDGVTLSLAGTWAQGDTIAYAARVDAGVETATVMIASYFCLTARGTSAANEKTLKDLYDAGMKLIEDMGDGEGHLDPAEDATPTVEERRARWTGKKPSGWGV